MTSQGAIWLSQNWKFGWDIARVSDKWFLNDYGLPNPVLSGNFFRETSSTVYLNGQGDRGYFDLRGFAFQGMANFDYQPQLATVCADAGITTRPSISLPKRPMGSAARSPSTPI